jgi:DNA-binding transcriptional ArsR family regulator
MKNPVKMHVTYRPKKGSTEEHRLAELNAVLAALAHPARRQILMTIHFRGDEMAAGEIAARFRHSWPTTTRHLRVLERARLVRAKRHGRVRFYQANHEPLQLVEQWLRWFDKKHRKDHG